jgi:hypothetical protein
MRRKLLVTAFLATLAAVSAAAFTAVRFQGRQKSDSRAQSAEAPARQAKADAGEARASRERAPVVVELFTSEGCSSCPPADALLARMEETQPVGGAEVIALAHHVDYWNDLGWSDPFSSRESSERQGVYARAFGREGVYTPQMVVDGRAEFPGGNGDRALEAIAQAAREPKAEVSISRTSFQPWPDAMPTLSIRVDKMPKVSDGDMLAMMLAVTEGGLSSDVPRGENAGRKLTHTCVVRSLRELGASKGDAGASTYETTVTVDKSWRRENLRAVAFLQERAGRRIVGAASLKLYD